MPIQLNSTVRLTCHVLCRSCEQRLPHETSLSKQLQLPKRHMQEPRFYFETGAAGSTGVSILPGAEFRVPFTFKSNTPGFFSVCPASVCAVTCTCTVLHCTVPVLYGLCILIDPVLRCAGALGAGAAPEASGPRLRGPRADRSRGPLHRCGLLLGAAKASECACFECTFRVERVVLLSARMCSIRVYVRVRVRAAHGQAKLVESEGAAIVRAILDRILRTIQPSVRPRTPPGPNRDPEDIFLENNANEEFGHYRCASHTHTRSHAHIFKTKYCLVTVLMC